MERNSVQTTRNLNIQYDILICFFLILITFFVYLQVKDHAFVNYDDDSYVTKNSNVQKGLTKESVIWAFKSTFVGNWHPLTWLSHMIDVQLFGMNSGAHHIINILFHTFNTLLLFLVFRRMTGEIWKSCFIAAFFAIHPLHVESVAWVAERKDVLSTFFWMLTMCSYALYAERPRRSMYFLSLLFFMLGLMSKPMLVTLPFVLLLLDYWPLKRFQFRYQDGSWNIQKNPIIISLIREKIPFFILSAASCAITFLVQKKGGAIGSLDVFPLKVRIANTIVSYMEYIGKMFWPVKLSVFYPHPGVLPMWKIIGACFLLVSISFLVIKYSRRYPWLCVGWLWYLGTLVPVIGLVQVGVQSMADRYTYIPLIGLFIIICWGFAEVLSKWSYKNLVFIPIAATVILVLAIATWFQVRYWSNSISLFEHAIEVTDNNYVAHNNLGTALTENNKTDEAISQFYTALNIFPGYKNACYNLGLALLASGNYDEAINYFYRYLNLSPDDAKGYYNVGLSYSYQGKIADSKKYLFKALDVDNTLEQAHFNLGIIFSSEGDHKNANKHYSEALRIKPDFIAAYINLGNIRLRQGLIADAISNYSEALRLDSDSEQAYNGLGAVMIQTGRIQKAIEFFEKALQLKPDYKEARNNLENTLAAMKKS